MPRVITASDFCTVERPSLSWIVPSYVPRPGLVLLLGEPKVGKSYLGLQLGLAVAAGGNFLGQPVLSQPVLYLQFDTSETVWRQRLLSLQSHDVVLPPHLYMVHPDDQPSRMNLLTHECQAWIQQTLDACNPSMIILDVLRECHNADEQDSTAMKTVGDILMGLFQGRTLVLIHHTHKLYSNDGPPNPVNASRGSSYITGKADAIWLLHNNLLAIESRFHRSDRYRVSRLDSGLFRIFT